MEPVQTSALMTAFVDLIPIVGGALIGVIGGLAGTAYAHRLSFENAKGVERRTKLEILVTEAYELEVWAKKQEDYHLRNGVETMEQSPMAKIDALAAMYFPTLRSQVSALSTAEVNYRLWLIEELRKRGTEGRGILGEINLVEYGAVYKPLIDAKAKLVDAARDLMHELFAP